ncbi:MAG: PQQ-binding-like beta-propeller repeat protein, partial [Planctomycetaceae bacterium]
MIARRHIPLILAGILFSLVSGPSSQGEESGRKPVEAVRPAATSAPPVEAEKPAPVEPKVKPRRQRVGNPFENLLNNLFGPAKPNQAKKAAGPDDAKGANSGDQTDKRAPHDPEQFALLQKAAEKMRDKNWNEALEILEFVLERGGNATIRLANGRRVPLSEEANRLLGALPPEVRESYRLTHGPAAAQLLAEAAGGGDPLTYAVVATRYFHTAAGLEAANHLGTLHFDRGEFGMASRWFNMLIEADAAVSQEPIWRLKAAFALKQSGHPQSDRLLSELSVDTNRREYEIGGKRLDPREWLAKLQPIAGSGPPVLDEWPILGGGPSRSAIANGSDPLLLSRWTRLISDSHPLIQQIATLTQDLSDQQRATIPALFPLMVNNRILFRTLRGVQVLDASTGEPLWETREGVSAERMLIGGADEDDGERVVVGRRAFNNFNFNQQSSEYFGGAGDSHPIVGLLYRNGAFGVLASDGRQLFVIEDHAMLSRLGYYGAEFDPEGDDPFHQNWSTNRLVSYDLNTGRPLWTVGGIAMNEPFDLPLAGTYFLGAPIVDGGELLIVGENEGRIHLFALDPATGTEKWSQLIAYADTKIDRDIARRWWTSQIACSNGVIVCPTTVGWLVGIDRLNHSVLWTQRYTRPSDSRTVREGRDEGESMIAFSELNSQWCPSAPMIAGNRIIYTPPEEGTLMCVDLFDGKIVWQQPKGEDGLYAAGVFDDRVIVVGKNSVVARKMRDGSSLWTIRLTMTDGRPSGVGVATQGSYYLPLSSGQLWSIDPATGRVTAKSRLPEDEAPLGNLALYRGKLISLTAQGLTSYEQRVSAEAEIRRRKEANPHDPQALIQEAEILRLDGKFADALNSLRAVHTADIPAGLFRRYRAAMLESLAGVIRGDHQGGQREVDELAKFASSSEEKWTYRTLLVDRYAARREFAGAFELLLDSASKLEDVPTVTGTDPDTELDPAVWTASRLAEFWEKLDAESRKRFDDRIVREVKSSLDGDHETRRRISRMYAFHPATQQVEDRLIEDYAKNGDVALAENMLLKRVRRGNSASGAIALERLARMLLTAGYRSDAAQIYGDLEKRFPEERIGDKPSREIVA